MLTEYYLGSVIIEVLVYLLSFLFLVVSFFQFRKGLVYLPNLTKRNEKKGKVTSKGLKEEDIPRVMKKISSTTFFYFSIIYFVATVAFTFIYFIPIFTGRRENLFEDDLFFYLLFLFVLFLIPFPLILSLMTTPSIKKMLSKHSKKFMSAEFYFILPVFHLLYTIFVFAFGFLLYYGIGRLAIFLWG